MEDLMTTALVIIDVQKGMFDGTEGDVPHDGESVVDRIAGLIARARTKGTPVMYVQHDGGASHPFHPGKPGFDFHDKLAPQPGDDVTVKLMSSAFHGTDFDAKLKARGIDHLIVTGMQSEYCVDSAVRGAYERGYKITLVSDAHSTFNSRAASAEKIIAIQNDTMNGSLAKVMKAEEVEF
jgi:nicotinamidase-related amidase